MSEKTNKKVGSSTGTAENKKEPVEKMCLVIMPFSGSDKYEAGHFRKVYDDIFVPAIKKAGFKPHRVDDDLSSSSILAKIVNDIIEAPIVLCDLSDRNPNVLYELGIRHAFGKPVVLVKDEKTDRIFDVADISTIEYSSERKYDEVLKFQEIISNAIGATAEGKQNYSVVTMVQAQKAQKNFMEDKSKTPDDLLLMSILNEVKSINIRIDSLEKDIFSKRESGLRNKMPLQFEQKSEFKNPSLKYVHYIMRIEEIKEQYNFDSLQNRREKGYGEMLDELYLVMNDDAMLTEDEKGRLFAIIIPLKAEIKSNQ